jgi:hypothetical protein
VRKTRLRIWLARVLLVGSIVGWPASALTWARDEPPFILALSWIAILVSSLDVLFTAEVEERQKHD